MSRKGFDGTGKTPEGTGVEKTKNDQDSLKVGKAKERMAEHAASKREGTDKKLDAKPDKTGTETRGTSEKKGPIARLKERMAEHAANKREGTDKKLDAKPDKEKSSDDAMEKTKREREKFYESLRVDKPNEAKVGDKKSTSSSGEADSGHGSKYDGSDREERQYRPASPETQKKKDTDELSL